MRNPRAAVLTMEGTNNESEAYLSLLHAGAEAEIVHLKKLENSIKHLEDYDLLFLPGGFSAGDYIRAGAIMAARIKARLMNDLEKFVEEGKLVMGPCNGFQVLIELGLLPDVEGRLETEAALAQNISNRFEARTIYVRVNNNRCVFLKSFKEGEIIKLPIAHMEGRFITRDDRILNGIINKGMNVLSYVDPDGREAAYPWNPNGSVMNIAGLCNEKGNILGLMPHPERVFFKVTESDWTRYGSGNGTGYRFFKSAVEHLKEKF